MAMSSSSASTSDRPGAAGGRLVLVGTPIGNLGDLAPRAIEALAGADLVCCEDTRRTGRLLEHAGVRARALRVANEHTEGAVAAEVAERVARGEVVAVVSDAGMPGISDPGERLVAAVVAAGGIVEVVPGPSSALAALVASGLPTGRFAFEGSCPGRGRDEPSGWRRSPPSAGPPCSSRPRTASHAPWPTWSTPAAPTAG
ncbi:MAG: SAM-dependent methyltransferase [Acidimicrobiales bacterium]